MLQNEHPHLSEQKCSDKWGPFFAIVPHWRPSMPCHQVLISDREFLPAAQCRRWSVSAAEADTDCAGDLDFWTSSSLLYCRRLTRWLIVPGFGSHWYQAFFSSSSSEGSVCHAGGVLRRVSRFLIHPSIASIKWNHRLQNINTTTRSSRNAPISPQGIIYLTLLQSGS